MAKDSWLTVNPMAGEGDGALADNPREQSIKDAWNARQLLPLSSKELKRQNRTK